MSYLSLDPSGQDQALGAPGFGPLRGDNGLSASGDRKEQVAVQTRYFSGRNSSATASCSGTSGKKLSRWQ